MTTVPEVMKFKIQSNRQSITAKKRVKSIIDFTMDFKSIVKSRHDLTVKSSALDLRLILLSNQLRINN